jgi:hypothetical protein
MENLIFALIASCAYRQQEPVVAEPEEFQPFDLQALRIMDQLPLYRGWRLKPDAELVAFTKEWSLSKSS